MSWRTQTGQSRDQEIMRMLRAFAGDPLGVSRALPEEVRQRRGKEHYLEADLDEAWGAHLHALLGAAWPCPEVQQLDELMARIGSLLTSKGPGIWPSHLRLV
jgi:hypothetical protein